MDMKILFPGGKKVDAVYKGFTIKTDQSKHSGGEETAPQPFDLFLASIGTCTGIYVLYFCQKRNISLENIELVLKKERNEKTKMVEKISIGINLPSEFPDKYKKALIKSAEKCAVTKHMYKSPTITLNI